MLAASSHSSTFSKKHQSYQSLVNQKYYSICDYQSLIILSVKLKV